jgi:hypothetical protein
VGGGGGGGLPDLISKRNVGSCFIQ